MQFGFGGATRHRGVGLQRFHVNAPHAVRHEAALRSDHAAVVEGHTLFPSTVVDAMDAPRLLVHGRNSAKIGDKVLKGPWAGLPVYTLTLEERATCPRSCGQWDTCYGNSMPMARRHRHGADVERILEFELSRLMSVHEHGFAVRLHVLGDFYSMAYVEAWARWMSIMPRLRVWGYTAHPPESAIGQTLLMMNWLFPERWAMRTSVAADAAIGPMQATTIWRQPEAANVPEGLVCPASMEKSAACVTCGLCWSPEAADKRIVFIGHGKRYKRGARKAPATLSARQIDGAGGSRAVAIGMALGVQTIERWRQTGLVPEKQRERFEVLCDDLARRLSA